MHRFSHVAVGGTFDHLHDGHNLLLKTAFTLGKFVTIGLATEVLFSCKKIKHAIEPYEQRKAKIERYIAELNTNTPFVIQALSDPYGSTISDASMEAIVVTRETIGTARKINRIRQITGLSRLTYIKVPFVKGKDRKIIRSGNIRFGTKDTHGNSYLGLFTRSPQLILPASLRPVLRQPLGEVIPDDHVSPSNTAKNAIKYLKTLHPICTICVGDIAYWSLHDEGYIPDISVLDGKTQRTIVSDRVFHHDVQVRNPPGQIRQRAVIALAKMIRQKLEGNTLPQILRVLGEEDLLTLPAILLSPLGGVVVYGQREVGMVISFIQAKDKDHVAYLTGRMA